VKSVKNVYEKLRKLRKLQGVELRGLDEGWEEIDKIHDRFCIKIKDSNA
jgi:hypothetical protein